MRPNERWATILERLEADEHVRTKDLSDELGVTSVTVRTDLRLLEERGRLRRVHGGAVLAKRVVETSHDVRGPIDGAQKLAIAAVAASLLEPGSTVVLDVGTTTYALAELIASDSSITDLTIVTNGLRIAACLEPAMPRVSVYVTGGLLRPMQHSLVHSGVTESLGRFRTAMSFIGCDGIHPEYGVMTTNLPEADIKEAMRRGTDRSVLVAAASKLDEVAAVKVNSVEAFDTLITSDDADPRQVDQLQDLGLEVILASPQMDARDQGGVASPRRLRGSEAPSMDLQSGSLTRPEHDAKGENR